MNVDNLIFKVSNAYDLKINHMEKIKNVYKICSDSKNYCLKTIRYEFGHFIFILGAMEYIQNNGFNNIPKIIANNQGKKYIEIECGFAYLTEWIDARESDYSNLSDVFAAVRKLAELHIKSQGFNLSKEMKPRVGWFKWIETFNTRKNEILDFKRRINAKEKQSKFDEIYKAMMEEELYRAENSIENLINSDYIYSMSQEVNKKGFCHHDYAHHNILINKNNEINIIDFDYCILDSHLHDLASIIIRIMKNRKWEMQNAVYIFDAYNDIYKVETTDIPIISSFIQFPQEYWQLGIQYYWEKKNWEEEFFLNKLYKIFLDRDAREDFVNELISYRYKGD